MNNYKSDGRENEINSSNGANRSDDTLQQWQLWKDTVNNAPVDLHDLADKMGLVLGKGQSKKANDRVYHSPGHTDTSPSLSIFNNGEAWKDHSTGATGGDAISLYMYKTDLQFKDAVTGLAALYSIQPFKAVKSGIASVKKSLAEYIADRCTKGDKAAATEYLAGRGISEEVIEKAWARKAIGWNDYTSTKHPEGEVGHGGAGVAFIVRDRYDRKALAVDTRYQDPALNGGIKTNSQGDKDGAPWVLDWMAFNRAHTIIIVESQINALSVLTAMPDGIDSLALRGTSNADNVPLDLFKGKMNIIAMDNDEAFDDEHRLAGHRPGPEAGWRLYDRLNAAGIPAMLVDHSEWEVGQDVNDILQADGAYCLNTCLGKLENNIIQGLQFSSDKLAYDGTPRAVLPAHDYKVYWRYRTEADFTQYISKYERDDDGKMKPLDFEDLAGFRIASVSRVAIQNWQATVLNAAEGQGEMMFAVAAQTPQHGRTLKRLTLTDEQFTNPQHWSKFGYIYKPAPFMRMTNILANTLNDSEQLAVNFVGLAFKQGKPVINEGTDCYFRDPNKQTPYGDLIFNNGTKNHARQVINAFQGTFTENAALIPVVWALGAHLKLFTGFWPHMQMEAEKSAGKSQLMNKMARAFQMQIFGSDMLKTNYRLQITVSYTGHPVMWEEVGTNKVEVIKEANDKLQEAYNYRHNIRGDLSYLSSAPVLLGGEEVDMNSLLGKLTRTTVSVAKQGPEIASDLPVFPMRQWLEFLAELDRDTVERALDKATTSCMNMASADKSDGNAKRIVKNFACIRLAWRLLCDFAEIDYTQGGFEADLMKEMNLFLNETQASRHPWVWIMEIVMSEIDARRWMFPIAHGDCENEHGEMEPAIFIRHTHIMDHIKHSTHLKSRWDSLPIRQAKSLMQQLKKSGVILGEGKERKVNGKRVNGMTAFSVNKLNEFGLMLTREFPNTNMVPEQDVPAE